ncbi:hypothetical protein QL285_070206 [Trifolium repens]|nr:hypothetical protein QL285_070206 [Trifolium repens]
MSSNNQEVNTSEGARNPTRVSDSTINQQEVDLDKLVIPRGRRTTAGKRRSSKLIEPFTKPAHSEEPKEASPLEAQSSPRRAKDQTLDESSMKEATQNNNLEPQTENEKNGVEDVTTFDPNIKDVETNVSASKDTTSEGHPVEDDPKNAKEKPSSEDEEEDSQSLEVIEIDEETESEEVAPKRTQSVADRVKRSRGKKVEIPKSFLEGKSQKRKRKPESSSEFEPDVEDDVPDIMSKKRKAAPSTSFHTKDNEQRWKIVSQRRIATERELSSEALSYKETTSLLKEVKLMKTMLGVGKCHERLVREFVVNLSEECAEEGSDDYHKVHMRGRTIDFSPTVINKFLERSTETEGNKILSMDKIAEEITSGQAMQWPKKGLLPISKLTVKYAILNRIGTANWAPTNHSSGMLEQSGSDINLRVFNWF